MRTETDEKEVLNKLDYYLSLHYQTEKMGSGAAHDVHHIRRMLKIAEKIVGDDVSLFLLKVTIWLHNLDRAGISKKQVSNFIRNLLETYSFFTKKEISEIVYAVKHHSELNHDDDPPLLRDLKDCDRLDIGLIMVLRAAAYLGVPSYLPEDFVENPDTSMPSKKLPSHLRDLIWCLEWEGMLRNPKAIKFGKPRFAQLRQFITDLKTELLELGQPFEL